MVAAPVQLTKPQHWSVYRHWIPVHSFCSHSAQMSEWFEYHRHVCIVSELVGLSTSGFNEQNCSLPFKLDHIRWHMRSVNFLHLNKLTYTDLKPENTVFVRSDYEEKYKAKLKCNEHTPINAEIKTVDFGCKVSNHEYQDTLVSARQNKAPEVIPDQQQSVRLISHARFLHAVELCSI
ncbi:dual specificity protein kinase CLK1 [Pithys albifrons albifrons]|uniref:dual specificity protein kinase CLK1 n=1 Tax=Pithys albifrons albifrons TaxID=3385563 RepID=UPI003A5CB6C2